MFTVTVFKINILSKLFDQVECLYINIIHIQVDFAVLVYFGIRFKDKKVKPSFIQFNLKHGITFLTKYFPTNIHIFVNVIQKTFALRFLLGFHINRCKNCTMGGAPPTFGWNLIPQQLLDLFGHHYLVSFIFQLENGRNCTTTTPTSHIIQY